MDRTEENKLRNQQKLPLIYCPFDCKPADVSPGATAYCCHLVGFTRDEKDRIFEPLERTPWSNGEHWMVNGRKPQKVQAGDVLVNPIIAQMTSHGVNYAKMWVSARVYRPCTVEYAEDWRTKYARPADFAIMQQFGEEDKDVKIAELEAELNRLKAQPRLGTLGEVGIIPEKMPEAPWHEPTEDDGFLPAGEALKQERERELVGAK